MPCNVFWNWIWNCWKAIEFCLESNSIEWEINLVSKSFPIFSKLRSNSVSWIWIIENFSARFLNFSRKRESFRISRMGSIRKIFFISFSLSFCIRSSRAWRWNNPAPPNRYKQSIDVKLRSFTWRSPSISGFRLEWIQIERWESKKFTKFWEESVTLEKEIF